MYEGAQSEELMARQVEKALPTRTTESSMRELRGADIADTKRR
jgi:hypothetical protein